MIRTDMTFLNMNTNLAVVAQGVILIGVVMFGSLVQFRRMRAMSPSRRDRASG